MTFVNLLLITLILNISSIYANIIVKNSLHNSNILKYELEYNNKYDSKYKTLGSPIYYRAELITDKYNLSIKSQSWMFDLRNIIYNYSLFDITFPGTHNSGAYGFSSTIAPDSQNNILYNSIVDIFLKITNQFKITLGNFILPWCRAQEYNVYSQLNAGIRYFDLRIGYDGSKFKVMHFLFGDNLDIILSQIALFINSNVGEIIIVEMSSFEYYGSEFPINQFASLLNNKIGTYILDNLYNKDQDVLKYNELMNTTARIILVIQNYEISLSLSRIIGKNTYKYITRNYANSNNLDYLIDYNTDRINNNNLNQAFFCISWFLTPQSNNINKIYEDVLISLAKKSNNVLSEWVNKNIIDKNIKKPNIIMVDYYDISNILETSIGITLNINITSYNSANTYKISCFIYILLFMSYIIILLN